MEKQTKKQQPDTAKKNISPNTGGSNSGNKPTPDKDKREEKQGGYSPDKRESEPTAQRQDRQGVEQTPRVNEDEQRKRVNNPEKPQDVTSEETDESEGQEVHEERTRPYKNVGDDSKENEKKSPTME